MTSYVTINRAEDGRHVSVFATLEKAFGHVVEMVGEGNALLPEIGKRYYSDWGNVLVIEERPDNWTAGLERRVGAAYNARECGTLTKAQKALLKRVGW